MKTPPTSQMKRKITIDDHQDFRRSLQDMGALVSDDDLDDIDDDLIGDPLVEKYAPRRTDKAANRVLAILDELERSDDE